MGGLPNGMITGRASGIWLVQRSADSGGSMAHLIPQTHDVERLVAGYHSQSLVVGCDAGQHIASNLGMEDAVLPIAY